MTDDAFLAAFDAATLPAQEWTHTAHVRMAFLVLSRLPFDDALEAVRGGIQHYNAAQGNHTGYHETITVAFVRLIAYRMQQSPTRVWSAFAQEYPELLDAALLLRHYARETLFSSHARFAFVAPDREPLP